MLDIVSATNLMNIYFYGANFNQTLYKEFLTLSQMTDAELQTQFRNTKSLFGSIVETKIGPEITAWYRALQPNQDFCSSRTTPSGICSFKQLTFAQWANNSITNTPMHNMELYIKSTNYLPNMTNSYTRLYPQISRLA